MKTTIKLLFILFPLILMVMGCPKPADNRNYTIKGKLVLSCDNPIPVQNKNISLDFFESGTLSKNLGTGVTDSNGNFSFTYNTLSDGITPGIALGVEAGFAYNYVISFPINSNADAGNVFFQNNFFMILKLSTDTAYTLNDTLCYYPSGINNPKYITGPFYTGQILDTLIETFSVSFDHPTDNSFLLQWKFPSNNRNAPYNRSIWYNNLQCLKYNVLTLQLHK